MSCEHVRAQKSMDMLAWMEDERVLDMLWDQAGLKG